MTKSSIPRCLAGSLRSFELMRLRRQELRRCLLLLHGVVEVGWLWRQKVLVLIYGCQVFVFTYRI